MSRRYRARRQYRQLTGLTVLLVVGGSIAAGAMSATQPTTGPPPDSRSGAVPTTEPAVDLPTVERLAAATNQGDDDTDIADVADITTASTAPTRIQPDPDADEPEPTGEERVAAQVEDAQPTAVVIPSIGVEASLVDLGLNPDRTLEVPEDDYDDAGWYQQGPKPGELGPAVVVGHVDSYDGPAVFYELERLQPGAEVGVRYDNGEVVRFTVERLEQHEKASFPTEAVYGETDDHALRLITCGGPFDRGEGHYDDNVIVFATLAE